MTKINELISDLQAQIADCKKRRENLDKSDWTQRKGCIISSNDAEMIVNILLGKEEVEK